jgi:tetratricopeptide (TPR) repeat protein
MARPSHSIAWSSAAVLGAAMLAALLAGGALLFPTPLVAQEPPRPALPAGTDPNGWEGYFDLGVKQFKTTPIGAEASFYWASRLDPSRAEPFFARWAAFLAHTRVEDVRAYFRDDEELHRRPEFQVADSLRSLALVRNPFVHRGLELLIWDRMPGAFADDRDTRAWIAYANGDFRKAIELNTKTIERDGRNALWRRYDRALAYVAAGDMPGALLDLRTLLAELRKQDERKSVVIYQSKHYLLYMIGLVLTELRRYPDARQAFQESLLEDASFAYGNAGLAGLSHALRQNVNAAEEYALGVELAPNDGQLRFLHAEVLFDLQRFSGAADELDRAIALEPYYPAPVLLLGRVREKQGQEEEAFKLYERYVAMSPANDSQAKVLRLRLDLRAKRTP